MGLLSKIRGRKTETESSNSLGDSLGDSPAGRPAIVATPAAAVSGELIDREGLKSDLPTAPPLPCLLCSCPAVWLSVYEVDSPDAAPKCCECDPPPSSSLIGRRWLLVVDDDLPDGLIHKSRSHLHWEDFPPRDFRRDPWEPADVMDAISELDSLDQRATRDDSKRDDAATGPHSPGGPSLTGGKGDGLGDLSEEFIEPPPWSIDQLAAGTLLGHRVPIVVPVRPLGRRRDGEVLTVYRAGWNDLVRLTARFGADEAWRILGERGRV